MLQSIAYFIGKTTLFIIDIKQIIRQIVIGDIDIIVSVVINIRNYYTQPKPFIPNSGL